MNYEIIGEAFPAVKCHLEQGEVMKCEGGGMSWMTPNMKMETVSGGLGKMFGRMVSGETLFQNRYTAQGGNGMITFASSFPGSIRPVSISPGNELVIQKSAFLASEAGVQLSVFFQKKFGSGLFGGEGFIMQKLSGNGMVFLEIDGYAVEYDLEAGQQMVIDTGYVAAMSSTCKMDIQTVPGVKNALFGGEGIFNTVVTGPGKIVLQTMPINTVASAIRPFIPTS